MEIIVQSIVYFNQSAQELTLISHYLFFTSFEYSEQTEDFLFKFSV